MVNIDDTQTHTHKHNVFDIDFNFDILSDYYYNENQLHINWYNRFRQIVQPNNVSKKIHTQTHIFS